MRDGLDSLGPGSVTAGSGVQGGPDGIDSLIEEFTGKAAPVQRTAQELQAAYLRVIDALMAAEEWPGLKGSPKLLLEEIIVRAGGPGEDAHRAALVWGMLAHLEKAKDLNGRVFLLRELAVVGGPESVPVLERHLRDPDPVIQEYAMRALAASTVPEAGKALIDAMDRAGVDARGEAPQGAWRVAVVNALGARREPRAVGPLSNLLSARGEKLGSDVARAAVMALGNIGTTEASRALAEARVPEPLERDLARARLLCADRLAEQGEKSAARGLYRGVHDGTSDGLLRMAALRGLARVAPGEALPLLLEALRSSSTEMQARAARLALDVPDEAVIKALRDAMPMMPPPARGFLSDALSERSHP